MGVVLLLTSAALLALPGLVRPLGRRVAPDEWASLCASALAVGAGLLELTLVLYAAPTVLRAAGISLWASVCERMLGAVVPGGPAAGWMAAAAAVTLPVLASVGLRRARRTEAVMRVEPGLGEHSAFGDHDLVILPTEHIMAVGVPGARGQIVISDGLVRAIGADELDAVLRHEAAHLEHRHHRYLLLATVLEHALAFCPPIRRSTAALRVTIERWADEQAAGTARESRQVLHRALLGVTSALVAAPSVAAFSAVETIAERLDALRSHAPTPSWLARTGLYTPGIALFALTAMSLLVWSDDAQTILALAGTCA